MEVLKWSFGTYINRLLIEIGFLEVRGNLFSTNSVGLGGLKAPPPPCRLGLWEGIWSESCILETAAWIGGFGQVLQGGVQITSFSLGNKRFFIIKKINKNQTFLNISPRHQLSLFVSIHHCLCLYIICYRFIGLVSICFLQVKHLFRF